MSAIRLRMYLIFALLVFGLGDVVYRSIYNEITVKINSTILTKPLRMK